MTTHDFSGGDAVHSRFFCLLDGCAIGLIVAEHRGNALEHVGISGCRGGGRTMVRPYNRAECLGKLISSRICEEPPRPKLHLLKISYNKWNDNWLCFQNSNRTSIINKIISIKTISMLRHQCIARLFDNAHRFAIRPAYRNESRRVVFIEAFLIDREEAFLLAFVFCALDTF